MQRPAGELCVGTQGAQPVIVVLRSSRDVAAAVAAVACQRRCQVMRLKARGGIRRLLRSNDQVTQQLMCR